MGCKLAQVTVEPIVCLYMVSFQLNMVTLPQLLLDNICLKKYSNTTKCAMMENGFFHQEYNEIQKQSSMYMSGCTSVLTAIALCTLPTVAAISDMIGKRKILFICPISQILQNIFLTLIVISGLDFSTWLLLLPNIMPALFGSLSGLFAFASAYVSLITSEDQRRMRMTFVNAAYFGGAFAATLSSGFIIEKFGYIGTYILNIILQILSLLHLTFVLKPVAKFNKGRSDDQINDKLYESSGGKDTADVSLGEKDPVSPPDSKINELQPLTVEESFTNNEQSTEDKEGLVSIRNNNNGKGENTDDETRYVSFATTHRAQQKEANTSKAVLKKVLSPIANFKTMVLALKSLRQRKISVFLLIALGLCITSYLGEVIIMVFYLKSEPFYMGTRNIGFYLAYRNAMIGAVGLGLFNWIIQRFIKISETRLLVLCVVTGIAYLTLLGIANSVLMLYCVQILNALYALNAPTIRSFISKMAAPESVGTVMGGVLLVECLASFIAGIIIPFAYAGLLSFYRGAAFFLLVGILLVNLGITLYCVRYSSKNNQQGGKMDKNNLTLLKN